MRLGGGRIHWYDAVMVAFAATIVYPDAVLDWVGARIGKAFNWWHVVALEVSAIGGLALFTAWLLPIFPRVFWWEPILIIGALVFLRLEWWLICQFFGFDD